MSLRPQPIGSIPEQTARVAHAAFPKGHPYLTLRDHLGTIFQDEDFAALFPAWGYPGLPPWRLALVTIMQFREQLSDRQAAEAVRARIDWKSLLGLALTDPGFDFSVLCEFRDRLLAGSAAALLLDKLLTRCRTMGCCTPKPGNYRFSLPMAECGMTIALPRSIYDLSAPLPSQEYAAATCDHGLAEERSPAMPDADVQN